MNRNDKDSMPERSRLNLYESIPGDWQTLVSGRKLLPALQNKLAESLLECFGYYGVVLGPLGQSLPLDTSPIRYWFHGSHMVGSKSSKLGYVQLSYDALPFQSDSVDTLVVPHLLDFVEQPHEVLREIERVMIPDGKVIITGLNPFSLYGVKFAGSKLTNRSLSEKRLIGLARLKDWLMLLGFSVEDYFGLDRYFRLPQNATADKWAKPILSHFCSHYVLVAKKEVSSMTPIRPSWKSNRKLVPARFAEPSVRHLVDQELKRVQQSIGGCS